MTDVVPIRIQSFRGDGFPGTELASYADVAEQTVGWFDFAARETAAGTWWVPDPDHPDFHSFYEPTSLHTGAAGVVWFLLQLADSTGNDGYLGRARAGGDYLLNSWRDYVDARPIDLPNFGLAYYGGLAGLATVLLELGDRPDGGRYLDGARAILDTILDRRATDDAGATWTGAPAPIGDGGIVLVLLRAATVLGDDRYRAAAALVGERILAVGHDGEDGARWWLGIDPVALGMSGTAEFPGFELGTAGVGFVLARLAEETGDKRYLDAAIAAGKTVRGQLQLVGDSALLRRADGIYSLGYCTGSAGVIRFFAQLYRATKAADDLEWALKLGRGILRSGVPGRQTSGLWNVACQCCGSAGILDDFIGLWLLTGDELWLEAARSTGDDLVIRSHHDDRGRRWYDAWTRVDPGSVNAEVGHQMGAAGIAASLLRLAEVERVAPLNSGFRTLRLPDDPFPGERSRG